MNKKILVPMKRNDRVEDFIPYVENVARRGMKVVFLIPYPVAGLRWSTKELGHKAIMEGQRLARYYTWDANLKKAKDWISAALKVLPAKGIEVGVDLYAGSSAGSRSEGRCSSDRYPRANRGLDWTTVRRHKFGF